MYHSMNDCTVYRVHHIFAPHDKSIVCTFLCIVLFICKVESPYILYIDQVVNVERQLDLNSCPSITTGHTTEESISSLSPSLSIDSGFSSIREKPQQTQMFGESSEMDIPESRTEFNEEMGVAELPSVNRLKALFSTGKGNDSSSVKRVSRR